MTYARRTDTTQKTIVEALRNAGYAVHVIGRPVDLLVRHSTWDVNLWTLLELKTPTGKRAPKPKLDKRQQEQAQFCCEFEVPYIIGVDDALHYLRMFGATHGPLFP